MGWIFPRTRTGCLSCRQRKKKCDEVKPHCQACERNKLACIWPPHIRRRFNLDSNEETSTNDVFSSELVAASAAYRPTSMEPASTFFPLDSSPTFTSEREPDEVAWSWELNTFLSPVRAGMLYPASQILHSYYLEYTAPKLAPSAEVPFVSWVMPVAYNDDLLMHSILALGGAHLSYRSRENIEIQQTTCRHYSLAVQALRRISEDEPLLDEPLVLLRIILTVIILCHYEVVSGNLDGSPFAHLRACRHLVLNLRNKRHQIKTASELKLYGFLLELYSYIVLCNTITPFGMNCKRTVIHDSFLQSLDDLRDFGAFGVMFGGGHGLFEMVSSISLFAARKEPFLSMGDDADTEPHGTYERLKSRVINWNNPAIDPHGHEYDHNLPTGRKAALELCRLALLIFLDAAHSPFSKSDSARMYHLQHSLDMAMSYVPHLLPSTSKFSCIVLWPLMIIGSCLVEDGQRRTLKEILSHNHYMMINTAQGSNILELLWVDPDEYSIGPYGLGMLMENYMLDYGVI